MLRWPPAAFWASTPHELWAAIDARIKTYGKQQVAPPSSDQIEAMRRKHAKQAGG